MTDVYFADATNLAFSQFYFRGSLADFVNNYASKNKIQGQNFCGMHAIHENSKIYIP